MAECHIPISVTLIFDPVSRIIVAGAYLLYLFEVGIPNFVCG